MPTINIDFSGVEAFDNLPIGKYMGSIDKVELKETDDPSKFDQLMASYLVIDGEFTGRKQSEFLSMSPKAAFRLKKWFDRFGLIEDDHTVLDIDEDTNLLVDPDLVGVNVIFEVFRDPKLYQGEVQIRTRLLEVLDDDAPAAAPEPARAPARPARAAAAPVAAPAPTEAEEEDDEEPVEETVAAAAPAAAAPRRFGASKTAATATAGPARRALR